MAIDRIDQRRHLGGHLVVRHRGEVFRCAPQHPVAQVNQRAKCRAERNHQHQQAQRDEQRLAAQTVREQLVCQRDARLGGLRKDDRRAVVADQRWIVQALAHGADAHRLAVVDAVLDRESGFARRRAGGQRQVVVAGDHRAAGADHRIEDPLLRLAAEDVERRGRDVDDDLAFERVGALRDRLDRRTQRAIVGAIDRLQRRKVGQRGIDRDHQRDRRQHPGRNAPAQAAAVPAVSGRRDFSHPRPRHRAPRRSCNRVRAGCAPPRPSPRASCAGGARRSRSPPGAPPHRT